MQLLKPIVHCQRIENLQIFLFTDQLRAEIENILYLKGFFT